MSAYAHSALRYRLAVPVWLLAIAAAAAIAMPTIALLEGSNRPTASPASAAQTTRAALRQQDTVCLDSRLVGHC
jgi:hypothetical protein